MHVVTIKRRHGEREYASTLVRRSVREGRRVRKETVANLSRLPAEAIEAVRRALAGETLVAAEDAFPATWRAASARWRRSATRATARKGSCRSNTG